jgi:hypothetical protein
MNTMKMPEFTAEASLYQTEGYYWTGRNAITSPVPMIGHIYPAMKDEEIYVHSCPPGWQDIGGSCWPVPQSEPFPGTPGPFPGTPGPFEGEPTGTPKRGPTKKPRVKVVYAPHPGGSCHAKRTVKGKDGSATVTGEIESGAYTEEAPWSCCSIYQSENACIPCEENHHINCANGYKGDPGDEPL